MKMGTDWPVNSPMHLLTASWAWFEESALENAHIAEKDSRLASFGSLRLRSGQAKSGGLIQNIVFTRRVKRRFETVARRDIKVFGWMRIERGLAAWVDFLVLVNGFMYGLKPIPFKSSTDSEAVLA
jgi:hypothetical protein